MDKTPFSLKHFRVLGRCCHVQLAECSPRQQVWRLSDVHNLMIKKKQTFAKGVMQSSGEKYIRVISCEIEEIVSRGESKECGIFQGKLCPSRDSA